MRTSFSGWLTSAALVAVFAGTAPVAGQDAALIPYQGQLADQSGLPVSPREPVTMVFRTYSQPTGGTANWEEAHEAVQVVNGRFSVLLGARQPFPTKVVKEFKRTVYLGVTVDDGEPETADIEMRPRQAIVPVISARQALHADRADQAGQADRATAADRATVAEQLDRESSLAREVERLERELVALRSYVADLSGRLEDLRDVVALR